MRAVQKVSCVGLHFANAAQRFSAGGRGRAQTQASRRAGGRAPSPNPGLRARRARPDLLSSPTYMHAGSSEVTICQCSPTLQRGRAGPRSNPGLRAGGRAGPEPKPRPPPEAPSPAGGPAKTQASLGGGSVQNGPFYGSVEYGRGIRYSVFGVRYSVFGGRYSEEGGKGRRKGRAGEEEGKGGAAAAAPEEKGGRG